MWVRHLSTFEHFLFGVVGVVWLFRVLYCFTGGPFLLKATRWGDTTRVFFCFNQPYGVSERLWT